MKARTGLLEKFCVIPYAFSTQQIYRTTGSLKIKPDKAVIWYPPKWSLVLRSFRTGLLQQSSIWPLGGAAVAPGCGEWVVLTFSWKTTGFFFLLASLSIRVKLKLRTTNTLTFISLKEVTFPVNVPYWKVPARVLSRAAGYLGQIKTNQIKRLIKFLCSLNVAFFRR